MAQRVFNLIITFFFSFKIKSSTFYCQLNKCKRILDGSSDSEILDTVDSVI